MDSTTSSHELSRDLTTKTRRQGSTLGRRSLWAAALLGGTLMAGPAFAGTADSLTTTFVSNNGQAGNMFDVTATKEVRIVGFDCNFDTGSISYEIYTIPGSYIGNETNSGAWTLVTSGQVTSNGIDIATPLPSVVDITIPQGTSMGFYVTCSNGAYINYTNGLGSGPGTAATNADMSISEGLGVAYPFSSNYSPRTWNGTLYYFSNSGTPFCFGDGTGAICPCGNLGPADAGCANSGGLGAMLVGDGSTSISSDSLVLTATDLPPNRPALLIAGTTDLNSGTGALFGDGFLCAGGGTTALGLRFTNGMGDATWGPGLGTTGGFQSGSTNYFQVIYRDTYSSSPCGTYFNASNGVQVDYQP